jgi:hypothetical protein
MTSRPSYAFVSPAYDGARYQEDWLLVCMRAGSPGPGQRLDPAGARRDARSLLGCDVNIE